MWQHLVKIRVNRLIILPILLFITNIASYGINENLNSQCVAIKQDNNNVTNEWAWLTSKWYADDTPYIEITKEIDSKVKANKLSSEDLQKYISAYSHENSPINAYRWLYARHQAKTKNINIKLGDYNVYYVFEKTVDPHSYLYTRLRFLIEKSDDDDHNALYLSLGKKLLEKRSDDIEVECKLVFDFHPWVSSTMKTEALKYANDLLKKYPSDINMYKPIASVYYLCWCVTFDIKDGNQATMWYKKFVDKAPTNDKNILIAKSIINRIKRVQLYQKKHPNWQDEIKKQR